MTISNHLKILFAEDLPSDADLAVLELRKEGLQFDYMRVDSRDDFIKALEEFNPDLVISDYMMPSFNGIQALIATRDFDPFLPFILCTGSINEEIAVDCMKAGATDYIIKEHMIRLPFAVKEALAQSSIQKEKRESEKALRESQQLFETLAKTSPVGIFRTRADGYTTYVNPKWEELAGIPFSEAEGYGWLKAVHPDDRKRSEDTWAQNVKTQRSSVDEYRFLHSDGTIKWVLGNAVFEMIDNEIIGYVGTLTDITERKSSEQALKDALFKAEAADKLKTSFLNNISHEVRTPLNGILGFAELMSDANLSSADRELSISMLRESSDRLLNTITNYVDISLIVSGALSVFKKDIVINKLLMEVKETFKPPCKDKNLDLVLVTPENKEKLIINSDHEILNKILSHLLYNAIKFTNQGEIHFGYRIANNELEFFVSDTGIGIRNNSINRIFEQFVKEESGTEMISEGSGLGLSISKGMVELLGGRIWAESEKSKGSTFFFTIPFVSEEISSTKITTNHEIRVSKEGSTILVAEDDDANFFYINALLKHELSVVVLHAVNGSDAIRKFIDNPEIDLILMDLKMPDVDGFEATRKIKAINPDIPIIALTAYAMSGDETKAFDAGCSGYITKPINKKLLFEKIQEFIKYQ